MKTDQQIFEDVISIDELFHRSLKYRNSEEFIKFVNFISKFRHYSRYNSMLVYIQNPAVTFFGSNSYWKKLGRSIVEDAKPHIILIPKGPIHLVYDIFDTSGRQTPKEMLDAGLGGPIFKTTGNFSQSDLEKMISRCSNWGIPVVRKPLSYFNAGYITTVQKSKLEICLKEGMTPSEHLSVLIHELAHLLLGHTGHQKITNLNNNKSLTILPRELTKTQEELEAETVSFLICKKLGLETRSAEYIGSYVKNKNDLQGFSYSYVIKTADKIDALFLRK